MVLLVSEDGVLIAAVERCAAAAGMPLEVASAPPEGRRWEQARVVLIGEDALPRMTGCARRAGVVVVGARIAAGIGAGIGAGMAGEPDAQTWRRALEVGAEHVVSLPEAEAWLVDRLGAAAADGGSAGSVVAVIGAGGGVGASTLALALAAVASRRGRRALVVDADLHGGGIEVAAGSEALPGARWPDVQAGPARIAPDTLRSAFPLANGAAILSVPRRGGTSPAALAPLTSLTDPSSLTARGALLDAARGAFDLVVLDLPRALVDDVAADARVILACDRVRPVLAAAHLVARFPQAVVAVRQVRGGTVDLADVPMVTGCPVTASFRSEGVVAEAGEHGDPLPARGALIAAAGTLLDRLVP